MAARNSLFQSVNKGYGENLYASWGTQVTGSNPVDSFYKEIKYYNYNAPGFSKKTGQLQQHLFRMLIHLYFCFVGFQATLPKLSGNLQRQWALVWQKEATVVLTSLFYTTRRVTIKANSVPMFHDHGTKSVPVKCISEWNILG
jgi:hypothetical protein